MKFSSCWRTYRHNCSYPRACQRTNEEFCSSTPVSDSQRYWSPVTARPFKIAAQESPAISSSMTTFTGMSSLPFPHLHLTQIDGKPTATTVTQLRKEVYANAPAIHSDGGGGNNGFLGIVMEAPAYLQRAGTAFLLPIHPGPQLDNAVNFFLLLRPKSQPPIVLMILSSTSFADTSKSTRRYASKS